MTLDLLAVEGKIENANDYPSQREDGCRGVRIDQLMHVVEQEPALVWLNSGFAFQSVITRDTATEAVP